MDNIIKYRNKSRAYEDLKDKVREFIKEKLNELQKSFKIITYKINNYDKVLKLREKTINGKNKN